jgi:hypothetical protein
MTRDIPVPGPANCGCRYCYTPVTIEGKRATLILFGDELLHEMECDDAARVGNAERHKRRCSRAV